MSVINVTTDITGVVWKIVAPIGAALSEDEAIMILESMKMEIPIGAPEDGTLVEILVAEGETVVEGAVIARIETQA